MEKKKSLKKLQFYVGVGSEKMVFEQRFEGGMKGVGWVEKNIPGEVVAEAKVLGLAALLCVGRARRRPEQGGSLKQNERDGDRVVKGGKEAGPIALPGHCKGFGFYLNEMNSH